jgi:predicted RNA-binding Zn-ribbon protein involved in translation (DUF1610 family)
MRSPQPYDVDNVVVIEDEPETPLDAQVIDGAPPVDSWHVQTPDGSYWGPVSRSELDDWAAKGRITPGCKLLPAGASEWFEASKVLARLPPAPPKIADATHATANPTGHPFRCPRCGCEDPPREYREITATGWVMFVLLLVFFFPLCFLGLLVTETKRVCPKCGLKIS